VTVFAIVMTVFSARIARERTRAAQEAAKATAVKEFLLETLGSANPVEGTGRATTVLEALQPATPKISQAFAGQPMIEAELRNNVGVTCLRLSRYAEAEAQLRASVSILERALGPGDPDLASPLTSLGIVRQERGDHTEAEAVYRRALALARSRAADSQDVLDISKNLALLLQDRGDTAEAEKLMREILALDRREFGDADPNVAFDLNNLGNLLLRTGRYNESEPLLREAAAIFKRTGHRYLFVVMGNLGELITTRGDAAAKVRAKYAACLFHLGRYPAAEEQLLAALPVLESSLGSADPHTQRVLRLLADLYWAWGKKSQAQLFQSRLSTGLG
jgi:tetratricopeptide (TPR) repeat protein